MKSSLGHLLKILQKKLPYLKLSLNQKNSKKDNYWF